MKRILALAISALFVVTINAQTTTPVPATKAPQQMEVKHANSAVTKKSEASKPAHAAKSKKATAKSTKKVAKPVVKSDVKK